VDGRPVRFSQLWKNAFLRAPKEKLIYGPNQIEAMINQNTTISQQLTLWNQNGSRVIRGKQIVTPIENAFLYVVPLYLTAEGTNFPQLKRVIAITGDKVVMEPRSMRRLTLSLVRSNLKQSLRKGVRCNHLARRQS